MDTSSIQHSPEFLHKRKMAVVLPVFVVPFLGIIFFLFGGGTPAAKATLQASGLNTEVPKATFKTAISDKLTAYQQKEKQEADAERMRSLDEYHVSPVSASPGLDTGAVAPEASGLAYSPAPRSAPRSTPSYDRREYEHLTGKVNDFYRTPANTSSLSEAKMNRLLELMEKEQNGNPNPVDVDRELRNNQYLQYLQRTLASGPFTGEKPVRARQDTVVRKPKRKLVEVAGHQPKVASSLPQGRGGEGQPNRQQGNSFYSLGGNSGQRDGNTISAVIHSDQTLVSGATVKLRLLNDIKLEGTLIPKNTFVYGVASVKNERLDITVENIRHGKDILPVAMKVYDNDGLPGVSIPGSLDREAGKQAMGSMASSGSYNVTMAQGVGEQVAMQAAQGGINGVKALASKKARLERVHVKANYRVYLIPENF
ncbi:conjugative transposon protein TraM [Rufibacter sediminis]|uniref:Conjugative transposon protein TraM n=1 Tax=Rufibacter sediminis TaxID=2762756 RepID=A0ABR6VQ21_9BACT|nr:conjugative transposon protein TraM [Rufibacter sediminis]MBC3538974.1 conjugative transposon protein TraM [Rufibacter sediminis]